MRTEEIIEGIRGEKEIGCMQYFSNALDPANATTCSIGALIKNLPELSFYKAMNVIYRGTTDHSDGNKACLEELPELSEILQDYYQCTQEFLVELQEINDSYTGKSPKRKMLSFLRELGKQSPQ